MNAIKTIIVLVFFITTGCATFETKGAMPMLGRVPQNQSIRMEKEGIEITVVPIKTEEEARRYFDENVLGKQIFAIYLNIMSRTSEVAEISSADLKVGKAVISPSTSDLMYKAIKRGAIGKAIAWGWITYMVGAPISAIHTQGVNEEIEKDVKEKNILESSKEIKPFGTSQGFVWFKLTDEIAPNLPKTLPKGMIFDVSLEFGHAKKLIRYEFPIPD